MIRALLNYILQLLMIRRPPRVEMETNNGGEPSEMVLVIDNIPQAVVGNNVIDLPELQQERYVVITWEHCERILPVGDDCGEYAVSEQNDSGMTGQLVHGRY